MRLAYQRVVENRGAPGIDGLRVEGLKDWLIRNWPTVRAALLAGSYLPQPVRAVEIAKPAGGTRLPGIPTVVDRLIQQALLQVLPAQTFIAQGKRWVVDIDLEKFFDRVNHDILMSRLARRITDERVLKLIRRYLEAGLMREGLSEVRTEGTPQGGPLSPLLSNIVLTDLDRELERRGHRFCRYADDCNVYVASRAAAKRAMEAITKFLEKELKLRVNRDKSAWARPWERKFLGYSFTWHRQARLKIAAESLKRLHEKVRTCLRVGRGRSLPATISALNPVLRGWMSYFRLTQIQGVLEELDGWVRRKLRCLLWRQWKRTITRARALQKRGLSERTAWTSATKSDFDRWGLVSLVDSHRRCRAFS